jgi:hypothetical protein
MRCKFFALFMFFAFFVGASSAQAQDANEDESVRGAFLTTRISAPSSRGKTNAEASAGTNRKKTAKPSVGKGTGRKTTATAAPTVKSSAGNGSAEDMNANASVVPIGLGYTLYMRDENGDAVRVDPTREFHAGERIRLSLEANTDGYLYIFHTENGAAPVMIFPDARLKNGDNHIFAHVPYEVPANNEADERLRWFTFDAKPAIEQLYIVVARTPLQNVPTGAALVNYCRANQTICPWRPLEEIWAQMTTDAQKSSTQVVMDKSSAYGQAQTASERAAVTRGLSLDKSAPSPSVIRMNVLSNAGILVTRLDLVHR